MMDTTQIVREFMRATAEGDLATARRVVSPAYLNRRANDEPPACSIPGVPGFMATSAWLRSALTGMRFDELDTVVEDTRVYSRQTLSARHTGPLVFFPPGEKEAIFPPTDRTFSVHHVHILRVEHGMVTEHDAVRDDLAMMMQLGFIPPSPRVGLKIAAWKLQGKSGLAIAHAIRVAAQAADAASA